jgi:ectoine hydroxylase-related dioxygenase (phytanoyl-CoA dioxygenase family)
VTSGYSLTPGRNCSKVAQPVRTLIGCASPYHLPGGCGRAVITETSSNCNFREKQATSLSEDELRSLSTSGFVTLTAITTTAEVAEIRRIFTDLVARRVGAKEGLLFDNMESETRPDGRRSIQLTNPSKYQRWLLDSTYVRNATQIAHQVLSPKCFMTFDFVLLKPAGVGAGTPWHQDEAYLDPKYDHSTLTFWMPLQDVDPSDGCMAYLPGSHLRGVFEHRSVHGDRHAHAFECATTVPQEESVVCLNA